MARVFIATLSHGFSLVGRRTLRRGQLPELFLHGSSKYSTFSSSRSRVRSPPRFPPTNAYIPSQEEEEEEDEYSEQEEEREDCSEEEESEAQIWRPEAVPYCREVQNVAHLTGVVTHGVNLLRLGNGKCKAKVSLLVHSSSTCTDRFCVEFWDQLAEMAATRVKESDTIYVLGKLSLDSYLGKDNMQKTVYKVIGSDFKFVQGFPPEYKCKHLSPKSQERPALLNELWQSYFENPSEWWDNRGNKRNPRAPDFKHKTIQEALWIDGQTPDWVLSKFETLAPDSNLRKSSHEDEDSRFPNAPPIS